MHCLTWNKGQSSRQELGLSLCEGLGGEVGDVFLFRDLLYAFLCLSIFFSDSRWQLCYILRLLIL